MKLVLAIVNNDDSAVVASALTKEKFTVTKLSTTGGFLMVGNTTLLIGSDDKDVGRVKEIISNYSKTRTHSTPSTGAFGTNMREGEFEKNVQVGGATVFVLSVDSMDKY